MSTTEYPLVERSPGYVPPSEELLRLKFEDVNGSIVMAVVTEGAAKRLCESIRDQLPLKNKGCPFSLEQDHNFQVFEAVSGTYGEHQHRMVCSRCGEIRLT